MITRISLATSILLLVFPCVGNADGMPAEVKKQIDDNLVGIWEYTTDFDGEKTKARSVWRWSDAGNAVIEEANYMDAGFTGTQIGGWDPVSKAIVFHAFTSRGDYSTARYHQLGATKWSGHGKGFWDGKNWDSAIVLEWTESGFRYEDTTDGKPFVVTGTRLTTGKLPEKAVKELEYFVGNWTFEWTLDGEEYHGTWSVRWAPDKSCLSSHWSGSGPDGPRSGTKMTGWDVAEDELVDLEMNADGEHVLLRERKISGSLWEGEGAGVSADGKPTSCKLQTKQDGDRFIWNVMDRKEGGESLPDLLFVFRKME